MIHSPLGTERVVRVIVVVPPTTESMRKDVGEKVAPWLVVQVEKCLSHSSQVNTTRRAVLMDCFPKGIRGTRSLKPVRAALKNARLRGRVYTSVS